MLQYTSMEGGIEEPRRQEDGPKNFRWRSYLRHPERMSKQSAEQLNMLADLLQRDAAADEFMAPLRKGQYKRHPVHAFVQFFRGLLED